MGTKTTVMVKKNKYRYFFISQVIRDGEREYMKRWCERRPFNTTVEDLEEELSVEHNFGVDADNMEIYTEDPYVKEMTEKEYNIVNKFI